MDEAKLTLVRLRLLLQQSHTALLAVVVNSVCYTTLHWRLEGLPPALLGWYVALNLSALVRYVLHRRWRAEIDEHTPAERLTRIYRLFVAGVVVSGALWGAVAFFLPASDPVEALTYFLLAGMTSGATVSYSASRAAAWAFLIPGLMPLTLWLVALGGGANLMMAGIVVIYLLLIARLVTTLNRQTVESLRLRFENAAGHAALRRSQTRLKLALQSSGAATWEWDGHRFAWEGDIDALLGLGGAAVPTTLEAFLACLQVEDRGAAATALANAYARKVDFDTELRLGPGGERVLACRGRTHVDGRSGATTVSGILLDVTVRRQQERLRQQKESAEAANDAKTRLLANVSHELRTPLTAVDGYARLILDAYQTSPEVEEFLRVIERNARHLLTLVDDLLTLAKGESAQDVPSVTSFSPAEELQLAVATFRPQLGEKQMHLDVAFVGPMPRCISSDAKRFRQVVMNLMSNAVKFTPAHGRVTVRAHVDRTYDDSKAAALIVTVSDTGPGIGPELARQLFRPFVRGSDVQTQKEPGSGLGLALSRKLAQSLGGELELAHSEEGHGSTFRFSVPIGPVRSLAWERIEAATAPAARRLDGLRLLLVEDSADIRSLLRTTLEKAGAAVETRVNGRDGVDAALCGTFDATLMDLRMPVMDGHAAVQKLRARGYAKPVIAITAHASPEEEQRCFADGFDDFMGKPIAASALVRIVREHCP